MPPESFEAYRQVKGLEQHSRYLGALIFGSAARGDYTEKSDFDVKVIVDQDNPCQNINHPFIDGVKLDITFLSLRQLQESTEKEIQRGERVPIVAESIIVFDKTGDLAELRERAKQARPRPVTRDHYQLIQFMIYHANNKAERNLDANPMASLLVMHVSFGDLLKTHYQLQERWWISDKRLLSDLRDWDQLLARLVERFVSTCDVREKYSIWSEIIDYILKPLGGRQPIAENNCNCEVCREDLARLAGFEG